MHVLEVYKSFLPKRGGVQRHIYDLCKCLTKRGHKPVVLGWRPPKPAFEMINSIDRRNLLYRFAFIDSIKGFKRQRYKIK